MGATGLISNPALAITGFAAAPTAKHTPRSPNEHANGNIIKIPLTTHSRSHDASLAAEPTSTLPSPACGKVGVALILWRDISNDRSCAATGVRDSRDRGFTRPCSRTGRNLKPRPLMQGADAAAMSSCRPGRAPRRVPDTSLPNEHGRVVSGIIAERSGLFKLLNALLDDLVDQAEFLGAIGGEKLVALQRLFDLLDGLTRVPDVDLI